ncbi:helix-turn-helix domain-containing protein [Embleya hyalina]|uniref:HTH cro/C1-type domain-containing protein n=1 Tax=Embleya hyalina TaxID=516124 RepID=A0A401YYK1_9ACTN|nr:helix-turn-helix transcriptional regulator [Embleya hyalina]GCD99687.1 hypothetical protein EHYA_07409 [Embleya hyalina]
MLTSARRRKALSLSELAEHCGSSVGKLKHIFGGKMIPSEELLISLATSLDLPLAELLDLHRELYAALRAGTSRIG